jgi:transcription initiation factor IIF auxiliary subunit
MSKPTRVTGFGRLPIVFGTISQTIQKDKNTAPPADSRATHRWTCFVRSPDGSCLSPFLKSVVFVLHNSFTNHRRVVTQPPYCVTEVGWGEFEIQIELHYKDEAEEQPTHLNHFLRLFLDVVVKNEKITKKPVLAEQMEELIFVNPTTTFYQILTANTGSQATPAPQVNQLDPLLCTFSKLNTDNYQQQLTQRIEQARQFVQAQTQNILYLQQQLSLHSHIAQGLEKAQQTINPATQQPQQGTQQGGQPQSGNVPPAQ